MGVVRTFQHVRLFREMTVIENLLVAQHQQLKTGLFSGLLKTPLSVAPRVKHSTAPPPLERIGLLEHANRRASNGLWRPASSGDRPLHGDAAGDFNARRTGSRS